MKKVFAPRDGYRGKINEKNVIDNSSSEEGSENLECNLYQSSSKPRKSTGYILNSQPESDNVKIMNGKSQAASKRKSEQAGLDLNNVQPMESTEITELNSTYPNQYEKNDHYACKTSKRLKPGDESSSSQYLDIETNDEQCILIESNKDDTIILDNSSPIQLDSPVLEKSHVDLDTDAESSNSLSKMNKEEPKYATLRCSICLERPKNAVALSKCGHVFCEECIMTISLLNKACPVCRVKFSESNIISFQFKTKKIC